MIKDYRKIYVWLFSIPNKYHSLWRIRPKRLIVALANSILGLSVLKSSS